MQGADCTLEKYPILFKNKIKRNGISFLKKIWYLMQCAVCTYQSVRGSRQTKAGIPCQQACTDFFKQLPCFGLGLVTTLCSELPYESPIFGQLLDLISPAKINLCEPRFKSYDPWDMVNCLSWFIIKNFKD